MQQTLTNKLAILLAFIAIAFGTAFTTYASNDDDMMEDAGIDIEMAIDAIAAAEDYLDDLGNDAKDSDEEKLADAKDLLADAEDAFDDEEYADAEELAEEAEDLALEIYDSGESDDDEDEDADEDSNDDDEDGDLDDDSDKGHGNDEDGCDEDNSGKGKGCDDDSEDDNVSTTTQSKYKDYGKSTDMAELQTQLRELLMVLIQLLQKQQLAS